MRETAKSNSRGLIGASAVLAAAAALLLVWDPRQQLLMARTVQLAIAAGAFAVPVGTVLALLLVRSDAPGRRPAFALLLLMLVVPLYVHAAAWDAGFGALGWQTVAQGSLEQPWLSGFRAAVWVHGMASLPGVVLILAAAARCADPELEEDAMLSAPPWRVIARVTLPRMAAGMAIASLWVLVQAATEITVTDLYRVRTYAEEVYTGMALGDGPGAAWRSSLPGVFAGASLLCLTLAAIRGVPPLLRTPLRPPPAFALRRTRAPAGWLLAAFAALGTGLPLANLVAKAGFVYQTDSDLFQRTWSFWQFAATLRDGFLRYPEEIAGTLAVSIGAATLAAFTGGWLAWMARHGGWRAWPAICAAGASLSAPAPLIGLAIISMLNRPQPALCAWLYDRTLFAPLLAVAVRILPWAILGGWCVLRSLSRDLLESASLEGAGGWQLWSRVIVPLRWEALLATWLLLAAMASGDLAASILVMPPGVTTVPIRTFGLLHAGVDNQVAGLCLANLLLYSAIAAVLGRLGARHFRKCSLST